MTLSRSKLVGLIIGLLMVGGLIGYGLHTVMSGLLIDDSVVTDGRADLNPNHNDIYGTVTVRTGDCALRGSINGEKPPSTCLTENVPADIYVFDYTDKKLYGTVRSADLAAWGEPLYETKASSNGIYHVRDLPDGLYTVVAMNQDTQGGTSDSVTVASDDVKLNLTINQATD